MKYEPENKVVFLPSAGYNYKRATKHTYTHSEAFVVPQKSGPDLRGLAHMFRCDETGLSRRYGFDQYNNRWG